MGASKGMACEENGKGPGAGCCELRCPVCSGPLVPLRGTYRCCRCFFSLCVGCEAPEAPASLSVED